MSKEEILEEVQGKWVCGFWIRIGALFVDTLILGLAGYILGLFLEDVFVRIGDWGRLVGFVISITYFGVMNSAICNGQTIGKKVLKIKVVDSTNAPITLSKSFLRYSFLAIPFSLNGLQLTNEIIIYLSSMIIFGGFFSIVYLYVFNRITRQSLHDLAVGTYVVNFSAKHELVGDIWKPHLAIVALLFIISIIVPMGVSNVATTEPFKGLFKTQKLLNEHINIINSGITEGSSTFTSSESGSKTTTYVNAYGVLYKNEIDNENLAMELARIIIGSYPESLNKDVIQVTLTYGYDIGITSMWNKHNYTFSPDEFNVSE